MTTTLDNRPGISALIPGDGVSLHAVSVGEGPVMLFLHGFPEFWYAWKAQIAHFGQRYRAVAVDMRGYNRSDRPRDVASYALPRLVADVGAVLDHVSPDRSAVLVGHDWGGVVAWSFAQSHPERLDRLVIVNAPHPAVFAREIRSNPAQRRASAYILLFRSRLAETLMRTGRFAMLRAIVFGTAAPGAFSPEEKRAYRDAWSQTGALTGGLNYYRSVRFDPAPSAQPIEVPTLVVWGEQDPALLPGNLVGLEEFVSNLRIVRIPEGTHWVVHEQPARVHRAIDAFLAERAI